MSAMEFMPMQMTYGFVVHTAMVIDGWNRPERPSASELVEITGRHPDVFPRRWTLEEAQYVLSHRGEVINHG